MSKFRLSFEARFLQYRWPVFALLRITNGVVLVLWVASFHFRVIKGV